MLTEECFFCGSILIDMIDNDIKVLNKKHLMDDDFDNILEETLKKTGEIDDAGDVNDWLIE